MQWVGHNRPAKGHRHAHAVFFCSRRLFPVLLELQHKPAGGRKRIRVRLPVAFMLLVQIFFPSAIGEGEFSAVLIIAKLHLLLGSFLSQVKTSQAVPGLVP